MKRRIEPSAIRLVRAGAWRGWLLGVLGALPLAGQVDPQRAVTVDLRTPQSRQETVRLLTEKSSEAKRLAEVLARQRNWLVRGTLPSGRRVELIQAANDRPQYYVTHNANAAISTGANLLRNTAPYLVNGSGYIVGVWDGGAVLATHQEFGVRVLVRDGAGVIDHATHVAGTIGASGVVSLAQGMAPSVGIDSYDWNNDHAEMAARAATGPNQPANLYISNHSYGYVRGWETGSFSGATGPHWFGLAGQREDRGFGMYDGSTASVDAVHFNAPYYLAFKSAGNDRNDSAPATGTTFYYVSGGVWVAKAYNPATDPFADGWDSGGFDTIEQEAAAKNIMTVGAVNDAVSGALRVPANGTMSAFSNWGPTDDGRIKPDIVANGVNVYSSVSTTNSSYSSYSGTSMSAPNASGTAVLLVDYFGEQLPGQAMRASTLKGLMIHTADDIGTAGPDYSYGWGLIDAEAAALQIKAHAQAPTSKFIHEGLLTTASPSYSFPFTWDGVNPIRATICWTDPAGPVLTGLDNRTPALVNDLDLRITGPGGVTTHLPFVLNVNSPASAATFGDNVVDNVEQVLIAAPVAGTYTLTVSHKGVLDGAQQHFSLLLSGQTPEPPVVVTVVATDASAGEPASGQGTGTFTFSRTGSTASALTVNFAVSGTATSGADFTALGTTVTFLAGSATATQSVAVLDDVLVEGSETVVVTLAAGVGYTSGSPSSATVTIQDDEAGATAFVTSHVAGTIRNNYSGWVGMQLTIGASPVTVTELGRIMASGNSGTHTVKLVKVSDGLDVPGGSVSIA
ncbi:MAG: S8 family serine peptidase, partial [Opitutaceae bacterium]|nr:S8 family serine peptidase [Opitutaceae bacterium]